MDFSSKKDEASSPSNLIEKSFIKKIEHFSCVSGMFFFIYKNHDDQIILVVQDFQKTAKYFNQTYLMILPNQA